MRCWTVIGILFCLCCLLDATSAQDFNVKVNVPENIKVGHQVHTFSPPASNQEYLFHQANDSDSRTALRLFKISERGIITTTTPIDYEIGRKNYYDLIAIRRNRGDKEGGIPTSVRITITDTNNYSPTFPLNVYYGRIKENSPPDVVVQGLENCFAEDRDTGGISSYLISGGNEKGYFKAETRIVGNRKFLVLKTTNVRIVKDTAPDISLTVRASDGQRFGTTKVVLKIVDANNNNPVFEEDSYSTTTSEDTPLLTSVLRVRATDLDTGTNGGIYYYISGSSPYFSVDAITGVIKVVRQLANLGQQTINVVARDRGAQSTPVSVQVTIKITDIPNYPPPDTANPGINTPPTFLENSYSANVREDFPVGAALLVIHAIDRDPPGRNQRLRYSLAGDNTFRIDANSGVVILNNALNYEGSNKVYKLTVTATDDGVPPQRATAELSVTVQDVDENRNAPKFQIGVEQQVSSVRENSQAGTQIIPRSPSASDSDQGQDGQVVYSISSGSGLAYFQIDENSGVVTTATPLDRELQDQYDLMIQARDKAVYPLYFHLYLMITVTDMDDNYPDFSQPIYYANVPEKAPKDTFVTLIHATDRDGQAVQYSINNGQNFFDIQSATGLITTIRPLDPTRGEKNFLLSVAAASGSLQSEAQVIVTVVSKSDSPPSFKKSQYETTVPENLGPIDNLLCLAAVDVHGKAVEYSIPTATDGNFRVDKSSGRFSAADSFDYEVVAGGKYTVTVQASSGPRQTAFTTVVVDVEDERDPPKFSHSKFKFVVGEMTRAGTSIIVTNAGGGSAGLVIIDEDTDKSQFDCSLESIQSIDVLIYFKVTNVNGECILVTQSTFDHFDTPVFTFDVRATDKNYRNMFASAKVEVVIQDTNNNPPEFSQKSYWASVGSNFPVENSIIKVTATDKDSGSFGEITYQLLDTQDRSRFSLDSNTGVLSSALSLAPKKYQLQVQASDLAQSESERKKSTVDVFVSVYSAGTTVIEFDPKSYTTTLPENSQQNTQVFTVSAKGARSIRYSIVGGNVDNAFKIEAGTGKVTTQGSLNRELLATYKLVVRAETSSPSRAAEVTTTINLSDVNDEKPRITFTENPKEIAIEDYSQTGAFLIMVFAVDRDIGNAGKVQYSILTSGSPFQIDKDSGVITAGREIRRTEKQQWDIQVEATDGGGLKSAASTLKIHVTQGSEAPQIQDKFDITLDENEDVGSAVKDISTSRDNSYKYSILSGNTNQAFCIDNTGMISVAKALDREKVSSYTLKVSVSVGNKVKNTTVVVSLRDKNDDAPRFTESLYTFEVSENGADRKQIGTVSATDRDSGSNGDVSYRLLYAVDANSKFAVDSRTGSVSSTQKLDFESIKEHELYLRAQDAGSPQLNTITKVVVYVKDENDEYPRFSAASYVAKVALDAKEDSQVLLVTATDLDSGDNGKVIYNITKGNDEEAFMIVQDTGVIKLRKSLTTVSADQFSLTVVAKDKGTPPRSGECTVQLNVFLPDGPPKFVVKPVVEEVTEGVQANKRVLVVKAATSEALTYEIVDGNADGLFRIVASTGEILVTRELDYEETTLHQLCVHVMDTRDRSDQVVVVIKVKNINDNPPKFPGDANGFVERKVEDDFQVGDLATRLSAYDLDAGDSVSYTLSSIADPFFSIDNNGFLIAKKPRNEISKSKSPFKFEVTAKDNGSPPRETKVQVQLVFVNYRPEEQPVRVFVKEDKEVGSVIAIVPRYFPGGTLSIIYPQGSNFTVDNSGKLRMTAALDFEDKQFYLLTVREQEPPPESRTNDVDVEINVVDINDNKPIMTRLDFFGRVNTNSRPGASAYQLKAEDKDGGLSGVIGYNLVSRGIPFAINPLKGLVETGGVLQDKGGYNVTLFAYDYGIPRQFGDAKGIDIKTVKFTPQFYETSHRFQVSEDALPGKLVGVVNASSVSGARLKFTIEQGDTEQKFRITPSGEILVNSLLDREERAIYNLKVRATEQIPNGYIGEVEVEITVLNANEFYPEFDPSFYSKTLREDVGSGASVLQLSASDCDCQACNCLDSGLLKFSLQGTSYFKVDEDSGVVSVGDMPLDYEMQGSHTFIATVTDFGEKKNFTSRAFVKIVLQNINDNAPIFQLSDYTIGIAEDAEADKALAAILARDADGSKITYTIPSGNTNVFQVNRDTGVLSVKQGAQVQSQTQYTLRVRATDEGSLFNEVRVVVNIEDSNDNPPEFKVCLPKVKVKENLKSGQRVTQVSAEDTKDRGRNKEEEYKLVTGTENFFQIDNTTGIITTVTSLDRETKSFHTLIVQAEDGGHDRNEAERLLSNCVIEVEVEDRNDNYPLFVTRTYFGSVYDKAPIGTSVVTVAAADADIAPNDKVEYAFSVPDNRFVIDRSSGQITTNVNLSGKKGTVLLAVRATNEKSMEDTNNPEIPRESETKVEIIIADEQPPKFTQPLYNVDVEENIDVGSSVYTIKADGKPGNIITYSLVKSNPEAEQKFQIDPGTGLITTASTLDYEERTEYKLQFRAKEIETNLYTTCFVRIGLRDVNDDTPTFKLEEYTARVPENANTNFDVIQVKADDRDTGIFGEISYSLDTSSISEYQFFNINPNDGSITTKHVFDREDPKHAPKYNVLVRAKDKGDDANAPLDAKVTVSVAIVDENDQTPEFTETRYTASVKEDAPLGTSIRDLTATDKDVGENAKLDYFVSSGNSLQSFRMKTVGGTKRYGLLVLDGKLDFETQEKFVIQVTATDRKNSTTVPVEITVLDTNDNVPEFTSLIYKKEIIEEIGFGLSVTEVSASDKDGPNTQGELQYSIDSNGARYLSIDKKTGLIKTANEKLDREKEQVVSFFVYAYDGKYTGRALVSIKLIDVNDNAPNFPQTPYVGYVEENKDPGTSVMVLQARDSDVGSNGEIGYTMEDDAGGRFKIDSKTGLVTTTQTLEREGKANRFNIRVKATDEGNPSKSGTVIATIFVTDGNDNAPKFNPTVYRANVREDALPGHLVTQVTATDADEGPNAELEFTIIAGNDPYKFYIDPRTGRIHVSGLLDFDRGEKSFNLTVMVADRGMPPSQADTPAFVYINLVDANDNPPEFVPAEYTASVAEDLPVGETVQLVTAVDHDTGTNALFNFTITDGDDADLFAIKPLTNNRSIGVIYTLLKLDRELVPRYNLTITATDTGGLQGNAMVIVDLLDVNDNGPWFIPPYYEGTIKAGVPEDQLVTTLEAYDPDEPSNGLPFKFSIVNNTNRFKLQDPQDSDVSAKMYSVGTFDRALAPEWILRVKGEDSGRPLKANFTYVYIDVVDDRNIHQPFDGSLVIILYAYNSKFKGGVIGKAYYKDNDYGGDKNKYTMPSQEFFTIDEDSGNITATANIPLGKYTFSVQVEEQKQRQGANFPKTVTSSVSVFVRGVSEAAVQNSVAVQILGLRKTSFLVGDYYNKLLQLLANILSSGDTDSIFIFSIQKAPARRLPVDVLFGVEIHLAVALPSSNFLARMDVVKLLVNAKLQLENLGLAIGAIGIDECAYEFQKVGKCRNEATGSSAYTVISGDYGPQEAPEESLTVVSVNVDLKAVYSSIVPQDLNCSTGTVCLHGGTCHNAVPKGIICECGREYRGPECQSTTRTFKGDSYIWLDKLAAYERSHVSLQFMTETANGLLLFQGPLYEGANNGLPDFMALLLVDGYAQLVITLGAHPNAPLVLYMNRGDRLDDREWHTVEVIRSLKKVTLRIDKCSHSQIIEDNGRVIENREMCEIEGEIWGSSIYLNGFGPLQIGGVENVLQEPTIIYTGFKGCIRSIYDNGVMYDLKNPLKNVNTVEGCQLENNACPDCNNRGYCEPLWVNSICVCDLGFSGPNCDSRSNANYYLPNSFSQYQVKQGRRKRRELVPPPVSMANEFFTNIALQVKVSPESSDVVILLASNSLGTEFNRIDVKNNVLRYVFRLGDRMKILSIPQLNITDNKYHAVIVKREGNRASLQVDYQGKVEGTTRGVHKLLNMGGGSYFAGGLPNVTEVRVVEAFVNSGGNAILRTADGTIIASGMGQDSSSYFSGAEFTGSVITVGAYGEVDVNSFTSGYKVESFYGYRSVTYHTSSKTRVMSGRTGASSASPLGMQDGSVTASGGFAEGSAGGLGGTSRGSGGSSGDSAGTIFGNAHSSGSATGTLRAYGAGVDWTLSGANGANDANEVQVIGDFGGCTAANSYNGVDLDSDPSIEARRQNVVFGCPCDAGFCLHGGTCINAVPPFCACPPGWTGPRCETVVASPKDGGRTASRWANPAVIACILVILLAVLFIVGAVLLKRRREPVVVAVVEDGHVHDNVRPYHDEGAGEEDNFGYDITQLMKYTYVENGGLVGTGDGTGGGKFKKGPGAGEEEFTVAEDKPLLQGALPGIGMQHGVTTITKRRVVHPESIDVKQFIDTRVHEADGEYILSIDELHIYRYEGDDSDVDDLSELGDSDEEADEEEEQEFEFLQAWGRKFDNLNRIFNEED